MNSSNWWSIRPIRSVIAVTYPVSMYPTPLYIHTFYPCIHPPMHPSIHPFLPFLKNYTIFLLIRLLLLPLCKTVIGVTIGRIPWIWSRIIWPFSPIMRNHCCGMEKKWVFICVQRLYDHVLYDINLFLLLQNPVRIHVFPDILISLQTLQHPYTPKRTHATTIPLYTPKHPLIANFFCFDFLHITTHRSSTALCIIPLFLSTHSPSRHL